MKTQGTAYDVAAVRALIIHRLSADYDNTTLIGDPDSVDSAAVRAVYDILGRAHDAGVSPEMSFGAGVAFGVSLAIAAINSPLKRSDDFGNAIDKASDELEDMTKVALDDRARGDAKNERCLKVGEAVLA